jgi:ParB-like chromosome segregation protein Spo0J
MKLKIESLNLDPNNARKHSSKNLEVIAESLKRFGQRKPIVVHNSVVIAGNGTLAAAKMLGWDEIEVTEVPADWDLETAKAYALADNRSAELASWDDDKLIKQLLELEQRGWDVKALGFDESLEINLEDVYTKIVNVPQYEVVGEMPLITDLFNKDKASKLQEDIDKSNVPDEVKEFLKLAATRHIVFNYQKIAEFYPHADAETQKLIEDSALVIIDIQDAIRNGYVTFTETMESLRNAE